MYDRSSASTGADEARLDLFARKQRAHGAIPPARAALKGACETCCLPNWDHLATYKCIKPQSSSRANWGSSQLGWTQTGGTRQMCWTILPPIATNCQERTKCSCKKNCNKRCKCFQIGLHSADVYMSTENLCRNTNRGIFEHLQYESEECHT